MRKVILFLIVFVFVLVLLPGISNAGERFDGNWHTKLTCPPKGNTEGYTWQFESVILSITTSGLPRHTFPETLLRLLCFPQRFRSLRSLQKTCHVSNLTVSACGRTSHLFGLNFDHDSPVQTPSLPREAGCPHKRSASYCSPQNDPGSPA
jgi:hypothetical protein